MHRLRRWYQLSGLVTPHRGRVGAPGPERQWPRGPGLTRRQGGPWAHRTWPGRSQARFGRGSVCTPGPTGPSPPGTAGTRTSPPAAGGRACGPVARAGSGLVLVVLGRSRGRGPQRHESRRALSLASSGASSADIATLDGASAWVLRHCTSAYLCHEKIGLLRIAANCAERGQPWPQTINTVGIELHVRFKGSR